MPPKAPKEKDDAEVTCPVCAGIVTLEDPFCPHCGAEFEAEEVEEVVEEEISTVERVPETTEVEDLEPVEEPLVEAKEEPQSSETIEEGEAPLEAPFEEPPAEVPLESELIVEPEEPIEPEELEEAEEETPISLPRRSEEEFITTSLTDLRVIGITLLLLGLIGAIIMLNIRWFWLWVPNMENNILLYALLGCAIILVSFFMVRKMASDSNKGKAPPHPMLPSVMLAMILFGFTSVVLFILTKPINEALKSSNVAPSTIFIIMVVVGLIIYAYPARVKHRTSA